MRSRVFSLRRRIVASFLAMTAATCLLFGLLGFAFAYTVEDRLFEQALREEVARQRDHWRDGRGLGQPEREFIAVYRDPSAFPDDLRRQYGREPARTEFSGDAGHHYHVRTFELGPRAGEAFAVAEVSGQLIVRHIREEMLALLGLSTLGLLLATALIGYWLANRATAPLTRLAGEVSEAGPNRIPHVVAADFPANEIGVLAGALERAFDRVRAFLDREKSFTRNASHELRTPLAVIRSGAELISIQSDLPPAVTRPLGRIVGAASEMERTLELLLSLAREESARPKAESLRLLPLVEAAVLRAGERLDGRSLDISIAVPEDETIRADPAATAIILNNIVENAFRHASGATLSIRTEGDALVIEDGGPGLPGRVSRALYEPFSKGETSAGAGLGLSIIHRLCEHEGIALSMETSADGTTARLGFPKAG